MLYDVTHSCGHVVEYDMRGYASKDRAYRVRCLERKPCAECERKELFNWGRGRGLPDLIGSEKQVEWAVGIRKVQILRADGTIACAKAKKNPKPQIAYIFEAWERMQTEDRASWWIDHRDENILEAEAVRLKELDEVTPAQMKAEEQCILEPEEATKDTLCEIGSKGDEIYVRSEYDPDIPRILKGLGMKWNREYWYRVLGESAGAKEDRMAEIANHLLAQGFPVKLDPALHDKAINGTFAAEHTRWVKHLTQTNQLCLAWAAGDPIEKEIAALPWASMRKNNRAVVKITAKPELLDFAELHGFRITSAAQTLLDSHTVERAKIVEQARKKIGDDAAQKLQDILDSSRDVLDDLKDEED